MIRFQMRNIILFKSVLLSALTVSEAFSKRIVLNLEFSNGLVLIGRDCHKFGLFQIVCASRLALLFVDGQSWQILVHRVQNDIALVVHVICQFKLMKRNGLFHPL